MFELHDSVSRYISQTRPFLIGDKWHTSDTVEEIYDPSSGKKIAEVYMGGEKEIDIAVATARRAFEDRGWRYMPAAERASLMFKLADLIEENSDELLEMEILNEGMPISLAKHFVVSGIVESIRYYAGWATKITGRTVNLSLPDERQAAELGLPYHGYSLMEPVGVVGAITPWNVPLIMIIAKAAPALAAGCTLVIKPAELTPLTALRLGELFLEAGFPPGVVNIVPGYGPEAGARLASHPDVDKIAFTGSTKVGKAIAAAALGNLKKVGLELGGKAPVVVFPDADLDAAAENAAMGIFINSGQMCFAGSRLIAHEDIAQELSDRVAAIAANMKVGAGLDETSDLGPLISQAQKSRVMGFLDQAKSESIRFAYGGDAIETAGYFVQPTVAICDDNDTVLLREEIFGPVLTVQTFSNASEAAAMANDTPYGLASAVWTNDLSVSHQMASVIKAGVVWVNCTVALDEALPFGGYKQSGWGREGGEEGVQAYLQSKGVVMALR
jgi:phenylacetaldehyde dehydrogenase